MAGKVRGKRQADFEISKRLAKIYTKLFAKNVRQLRKVHQRDGLCQKYSELEAILNEGSCEEINTKLQEIWYILNERSILNTAATTYYFKIVLSENLIVLLKSGQLFNFIRMLSLWEKIIDCIVRGQENVNLAGTFRLLITKMRLKGN